MSDFLEVVLGVLFAAIIVAGLILIGSSNAKSEHISNCMKAMGEYAHNDAVKMCDYVVLGKERK